MKIIIYNILIVFALNLKCFSQDLSSKLVGAWEYIGTKHTKHIECADILIFNSDSTYLILNDCYAFDPIKPIVETGNWKRDQKLSQISLINRKISKEYIYQNSKAKLLILYVKKFADPTMEICFVNKTGCTPEVYKKSERKMQ